MSMNDPEVTMLDALPNSNLIAYRKALEAAGIALELVTSPYFSPGVYYGRRIAASRRACRKSCSLT